MTESARYRLGGRGDDGAGSVAGDHSARHAAGDRRGAAAEAPPPVGFYERKVAATVYTVLPGHHLVIEDAGAAISTLLGSCVAACIRDRRSGIGGLNHFLLPGRESEHSARYGAHAMDLLIGDILARGAERADLEAKVFGGAAVIAGAAGQFVGQTNAVFVRDYLRSRSIPILAEDLGGSCGRRLYYFPDTGKAKVQYMTNTETTKTLRGETALRASLVPGGAPHGQRKTR